MEQSIQEFLNTGAILATSKGQVLLAWGQGRAESHPDVKKFSVYAPDYFLTSPQPWLVYDNWLAIDKINLHRLLLPWALLFNDEAHWQPPLRSEFEVDYEELQTSIRHGELNKGVPYVIEQGSIHTGLSWRARTLIHLLEQPDTSRVYGMWSADEGLIGATPETLFEIMPDEESLRTMALAGTQDIAEDALDFLQDAKQVHEHRVVVDDIVSRLRQLGGVTLKPMRVLELPRMRHLLTEIRVDLREAQASAHDFEKMAHLLHPTPALGAAPREPGWRWLQKLEQHRPRYRFGAPFGVSLANEVAVCLVAIRNVQWYGERLWLGAGCGVVEESRIDDEWDELSLKRESTKRMLGL